MIKLRAILFSVATVSFLGLTSCGDYGKLGDEHAEADQVEDSNSEDMTRPELSDAEAGGLESMEKKVQTVTELYIGIKNSLVQSDVQSSKRMAQRMVTVLEAGIPAGEFDRVNEEANVIANSEDLGEMRDHFKTLSERMHELIEMHPYNSNKLYWDHCPMAFNNQGAYWLSETEEIANPYFGDKMLRCGSVQQELPVGN